MASSKQRAVLFCPLAAYFHPFLSKAGLPGDANAVATVGQKAVEGFARKVVGFGRPEQGVLLLRVLADELFQVRLDPDVPDLVGAEGMPAVVFDAFDLRLQLRQRRLAPQKRLPDNGGSEMRYWIRCWFRWLVTTFDLAGGSMRCGLSLWESSNFFGLSFSPPLFSVLRSRTMSRL